MVKGFQLTLARPSSGLVSLAIFMDKKEDFFFFSFWRIVFILYFHRTGLMTLFSFCVTTQCPSPQVYGLSHFHKCLVCA